MHRRRRAALALLLALAAAGCGQPSWRAAPSTADEHVFLHVHEFPDMGARIAPPTGTPRLSWRQALQAATRLSPGWPAHSPPQVKLADFSHCCNGEGPVRPTLVWVLVYPDAEVVEFGPDYAPPPARVGRCPAYVVVDATSGRGWGAFQTCDPPYRG
jgi:hypothetical protein